MSSLPRGTRNPLDAPRSCSASRLGEKVAARDDAHQRDVFRALVGLEDLVRHARHRSLDFVCIHADRLDRAPASFIHTPFVSDSAYRRVPRSPASEFSASFVPPRGQKKKPVWRLGFLRRCACRPLDGRCADWGYLVGLSVPHLKDDCTIHRRKMSCKRCVEFFLKEQENGMATGSPKEISQAPTGACNSLEARPSGLGAVRESAECEGQVPVGATASRKSFRSSPSGRTELRSSRP